MESAGLVKELPEGTREVQRSSKYFKAKKKKENKPDWCCKNRCDASPLSSPPLCLNNSTNYKDDSLASRRRKRLPLKAPPFLGLAARILVRSICQKAHSPPKRFPDTSVPRTNQLAAKDRQMVLKDVGASASDGGEQLSSRMLV